MINLSSAYNPKENEDKIYKLWEDSGYFNPDNLPADGEPYSIMMPPPNVTGILHLGHALEDSLMDAMSRYQRMKGRRLLLLPGTDHAAIATQARVEKNLQAQGIENPRQLYGREKLLGLVREYAENSKSTILNQIKKMGTSCDWSRLAYTFDESRSVAVNTVFKKMYDDGLIYRGYRVINWSVKGQSTCSDDELVHVEREAKFYTFKYSKDFPFSIATTRPETKLGDTAVAVNPKDERYKDYIGKTFEVNFVGSQTLKLKVIADDNVDPAFGTGALGVTPAHSMVDYEMYVKQKAKEDPIDIIPVIGPDGLMTDAAGKDYVGLTVEDAREKVVESLRALGLLEKEETIMQNVGTSDRFGDMIESLPMTQWFVNVNQEIPGRNKTLKDLMREAVTTGLDGRPESKITITPDRYQKTYLNWIEHLRDWCVSRQIWWGHRVPAWYCRDCKEIVSTDIKPVQIIGMRHGQANGNHDDRLNSSVENLENHLTAEGQKEIESVANEVNGVSVIYSSDLLRTKETAAMVAAKFGLTVQYDERLREVGVGEYEGQSNTDFTNFRKENFEAWQHDSPKGIESFDHLKERVYSFLSDIAAKHQGEKVLIVTHGDVLRLMQNYHENLTDEQLFFDFGYPDTGKIITKSIYDVKCKCGSNNIYQDEDTLDTWFSSGLWTFSTLGWPQQTSDLQTYHPTTWMQMGHELIPFWMARMILMTTYIMDEVPFRDVYIHGILRDEKGQKFSKSLGNGIDPIEMIDKYGTDALRLSLITGITPGNDARFYEEKVEGTRNFVNKLWNISRYILSTNEYIVGLTDVEPATLVDRWILAKLEMTKQAVNRSLESYDFSIAAESLREFTWSDLADWYLEAAKAEKGKEKMLSYLLREVLKLWHPFLPYVTETIWQSLGEPEILIVTKWPAEEEKHLDNQAIADFASLADIVVKIRNIRGEYHIDPVQKLDVVIKNAQPNNLIEANLEVVKFLSRVANVSSASDKPEKSAALVAGGLELFVPLQGVIDVTKETERLNKEIENVDKYCKGMNVKLGNADFVNHAPAVVVEVERQKLAEAQTKLEKLREQLSILK